MQFSLQMMDEVGIHEVARVDPTTAEHKESYFAV